MAIGKLLIGDENMESLICDVEIGLQMKDVAGIYLQNFHLILKTTKN